MNIIHFIPKATPRAEIIDHLQRRVSGYLAVCRDENSSERDRKIALANMEASGELARKHAAQAVAA